MGGSNAHALRGRKAPRPRPLRCNMGCVSSKSSSGTNRVVPIAANPDDGFPVKSKEAWGSAEVKRREEMTDEERSNNSTPPRTAGTADEVTPVDCEEKRTPEDVSKAQPVNLDRVLAEAAAMFDDQSQDTCGRSLRPMEGLPVKLEVQETTVSEMKPPEAANEPSDDIALPQGSETSASVAHWERQEPLPARPGTSSRRPESSGGRLVVYKTSAQKRAEQEARRKRMESENRAASAGNIARPGTSSRKMSALPPLEERRRAKPVAAVTQDVQVVAVNEAKGGASWQIDAAGFMPEADACSSPTKRRSNKQETNVFSVDEDDECLSPVKKPSHNRADVFSLED